MATIDLPDGLHVVRTAGPFDRDTVPPALLRDHRVAEGTWGRLRVLAGSLRLTIETDPRVVADLQAGEEHAIPSGVLHAVALGDDASFVVDFLTS